MEYISKSLKETKKIASEFAKKFAPGEVVFLVGDLGTGKTTFVQAVAGSFGYTDPVRSPTFSIMNIYPIKNNPIKQIIHFDLYRIEDDSELDHLDLEEYLNQPESVVFIEWPRSKIEAFLKKSYHKIKFEHIDANSRRITIIN